MLIRRAEPAPAQNIVPNRSKTLQRLDRVVALIRRTGPDSLRAKAVSTVTNTEIINFEPLNQKSDTRYGGTWAVFLSMWTRHP